jgi:peptide/nickel transport system permease protein
MSIEKPLESEQGPDAYADAEGDVGRDPFGGMDLEEVLERPMWRIRLELAWRSFRSNWSIFRRNVFGMLGLAIIIIFVIMALIHPMLMGTVWDARTYHPVMGYSAPIRALEVVDTGDVTNPAEQIERRRAQLQGHPFVEIGETIEVRLQPAPPSRDNLLGTDPLGRDVLSQLLYSTRAAFAMAAIAALTTAIFATLIGAAAAYFGGTVDNILMRIADLLLLLPLLALLIFVAGIFDITLPVLGILIGVASGFGGTAIVLKSQALAVSVKPFIDAAKVAGGSHWRIISRHIVPNILPLAFLYMMFTVTLAIGSEATLSFFGLLDVAMSWGIMIHTAQTRGYLLRGTEYWWLLIPAGLAVTLLAAAFYLVGRALDEIVNPRLRER